MNLIGSAIKRHWHLIVSIILLLLFIWLIFKLISVVLPFLVGLIIAYLLLPIVRWLERHLPGGKRHPAPKRISIIIGVYFVAIVAIAGMIFYMFTVINSSISQLWQTLPQLISEMTARVQSFLAAIRLEVPASMLQQYDQAIQNAGVSIINLLRSGLGQSFSIVRASSSLILGFLSLPLIVFFLLKDWDNLRDGLFRSLPAWAGDYVQHITGIFGRVLGRYIRGQIIMSAIIGTVVFVMLTILKIPFAPALAFWAALMENIPMLGIWMSILAGVAITLATSPSKVLWVAIGYIVINLLENNLLAPRVQGSNMKMNPIFIILVSVVGAYSFGLVGFIIAVPITVTIIELFKYFHIVFRQKEAE